MNPSTNNTAFDYANFWDFDGEYDDDSEFVVACRLIVSAHVSALAAAISLGETSAKNPTLALPNEDDHFFASLIGDVTPAAAAVASIPLTESPMIDTPFLDPCTGTPFTPATTFTPSLNTFQATPFMGSCNVGFDSKDIQVANYLRFDTSSWASPAITFNGDPTQLVRNQQEATEQQAQIMSGEDTDVLFPPLPSDNNKMADLPSSAAPDILDDFSQHFDGLDASLFQDENNNDLLTLDDLFGFNDIEPVTINPQPEITEAQVPKKKRKQPLDDQTPSQVPAKRKRLSINADDALDGKRFECPVCQSKFSRRYNLGTHIKTHDKQRQKNHSCYLCNKAFDRKHDCDRHISTVHHGERSFSCNECSSTFSRKDALTRHMVQKHEQEGMA
ncbi:hypothetical protein DFQ28_005047 [Apophysomyces sp. BC1034]|nr:hypothetical protein DFQ30_002773 [Apophysomyces sp. BC1015]KAG0183038.1 hypothetical protein DFQ29_000459 [Apophysomyces sp. BC1021]KAG0194834.1 hypothetical protein DFQ28_005047 [Apophysomyces sp. BC1034]